MLSKLQLGPAGISACCLSPGCQTSKLAQQESSLDENSLRFPVDCTWNPRCIQMEEKCVCRSLVGELPRGHTWTPHPVRNEEAPGTTAGEAMQNSPQRPLLTWRACQQMQPRPCLLAKLISLNSLCMPFFHY